MNLKFGIGSVSRDRNQAIIFVVLQFQYSKNKAKHDLLRKCCRLISAKIGWSRGAQLAKDIIVY